MNIQWKNYRELEQISDTVSQPQANRFLFAWIFRPIQRSLADASVRDLPPSHLLEHLEGCFSADTLPSENASTKRFDG